MNDERRTPQWLFDKLNGIYHFTLDAAASKENTKCEKFYSLEDSAFDHSWEGEVVFCNPPYSRGSLIKWVQKADEEAFKNTTVLMILPGDTSTKWFPWQADKLCFLRKRIAFDGIKASAKFPTVIAVWEKLHPLYTLGLECQIVG